MNVTRHRRAFTLLELVVTLVVLAAIAGITVPSYTAVIARVKDHSAELTMVDAGVQALKEAASHSDGVFTAADFTATSSAAYLGGGVSAAGGAIAYTTGASSSYGLVSWALSPDAGTAGLAMLSLTGRCVYSTMTRSTSVVQAQFFPGHPCTGYAAGVLLAGWPPLPGPSGSIPPTQSGHPSTGTFTVPDGLVLQAGPSATGPFSASATSAAGCGPVSVSQSGATGYVTVNPPADFTGTCTLDVIAADAIGNTSDPVPVTVTVTGPNMPPTAADVAATAQVGTVDVDLAMSATVSTTGSAVTAFEVETLPAAGTLLIDAAAGGTPDYVPATVGAVTSNPVLRYTPPPNTAGTFSMTYVAAATYLTDPMSLWSTPATATWTFTPAPPATAPPAPTGSLSAVVEGGGASASGTLSVPGTGAGWTWQVAPAATGPFGPTATVPAAGTASVTGTSTSATVTFTPDPAFAGQVPLWVRTLDPVSGLASPPTLVVVTVTCNPALTHSVASPCTAVGGGTLVAGSLTVNNNTTVFGDTLVPGATTISNQAHLQASTAGFGYGNLTGGSLSVLNGANAAVDGTAWLSGGLSNASPQTVVGGSVLAAGGSVSASKLLTVGGDVLVNSPGTITGSLAVSGTRSVGAGLVPAVPAVHIPVYDGSRVHFDQTFATWAAAQSWLSGNGMLLGTPGYRTLHVTAATAGTLSLGSASVNGDVLLVADAPMTLSAWPGASAAGSTLTVVGTSGTGSALTVSAFGAADPNLGVTLATAGTLSFAQKSSFYGEIYAHAMAVANQTSIFGRPAGGFAPQVLFVAP